MVDRAPFSLVYAPLVRDHLRSIEPRFHALIRENIENQLQFEPDIERRNRKPLKRATTFGARWEIRFGPVDQFRVFYRVNLYSRDVYILAIGEKRGSRLFIGGQEVEL
jgi:hypothetical protein